MLKTEYNFSVIHLALPDGYRRATVVPNYGLSQNNQEQEGNQTPV